MLIELTEVPAPTAVFDAVLLGTSGAMAKQSEGRQALGHLSKSRTEGKQGWSATGVNCSVGRFETLPRDILETTAAF